MMQRAGVKTRPPFPTQLLDTSVDEYADILRQSGYSERFIEKECEKLEQFHKMYLPVRKKTVNDVPVKDTNDKAFKALERVLNKKDREQDEQTVKQKSDRQPKAAGENKL